jgi:hypothetical protein
LAVGYSGVLFVTEALRGVVPKLGPDLDPKFDSEQGRRQIFESGRKEEIRNSTQSALVRKTVCCPFNDKM